MGHKRLGQLPNTGGWRRFKIALGDETVDASAAAEAALSALGNRLASLQNDPGLGHSFWLLTQIAWQAKNEDFGDRLRSLGVELSDPADLQSPIRFVARVADAIQGTLDRDPKATAFSHVAQLALRETLTGELRERTASMFGTSTDELRTACGSLGTSKQFGSLSARFFSKYLSRLLGYFIEREIPNHIGAGKRFKNPAEVQGFHALVAEVCTRHAETLEGYFRERAEIVESFAGSYASLHNYRDDLNLPNIKREFIPYALKKLKSELERSRAGSGAAEATNE
jgi:hypothetical protein